MGSDAEAFCPGVGRRLVGKRRPGLAASATIRQGRTAGREHLRRRSDAAEEKKAERPPTNERKNAPRALPPARTPRQAPPTTEEWERSLGGRAPRERGRRGHRERERRDHQGRRGQATGAWGRWGHRGGGWRGRGREAGPPGQGEAGLFEDREAGPAGKRGEPPGGEADKVPTETSVPWISVQSWVAFSKEGSRAPPCGRFVRGPLRPRDTLLLQAGFSLR